MTTKRVIERAARPFAETSVDREAGVVRNVVLCGFTSANGRDYPADVFKRDYALYEGRPVNADHGKEASVGRRIGWFQNVRPGPDGRPRGDFHVLKSHPLAESVFEAAERNPSLYGFSHVALCDTRMVGGREKVEAIRSVESIDLVAEPATTKGLYESTQGGRPVPTVLIRELAPKLAGRATAEQLIKVKKLAEMDGMGDAPMGDLAMPEPADTADADDAITSAFKTAMHSLIDGYIGGDLDLPGLLGKLKSLAKAHGDVTDDSAATDDEPTETPTDEGRKGGSDKAIYEALEVAERVGLPLTRADLETLAAVPADRREHTAKRFKEAAEAKAKHEAGDRPRSTGRTPVKATESRPAADDLPTVPTDPTELAKWLREAD